jgi:hypothetical protein
MTTFERHYTRDDRAQSVYQYIVVDVPAAAPALTVRLDYDRTDAVVDLGLIGPDRFGGWSGGERSVVSVTPTWATPGYTPGEIAGGWQVVLGLYRVGPAGVTVYVDVDTTAVEPPPPAPRPPRPERPPRRDLPATRGRTWLACDFHSHTVHSDGGLEIDELAVLAASRGLDVLAITDHNTVSHHPHLAAAGAHAGVLLLPGQEVTTDHGHANCFGALPWIDFREPPDMWRATTEAHGGLMAVNHPWAGDCAWRLPLTGRADLVEMWHSTWDLQHPVPLTEWAAFAAIPIGGSDFHRREGGVVPARPTTWVECEDVSIEGVLDGLRHRRTAISARRDGPVVLRHDGELVEIDAVGCDRLESNGLAYLVADDHVAALTVST